MSVAAKKWVRKHSPAKGRARVVLAELAWGADDAGHGARLSTAQLVGATGLSRSTVKRAIAELEEAQLVIRHRGGRDHCDACSQARHGTHVFDVVMPDLSEVADPNQMTLLDVVHVDQAEGPDVDQVQNGDLGQGGPGSWSRVDQQEEYEDVSLSSLDQVGPFEENEETPASLDGDFQPVAREGERGRARGPASLKPVTYRGRTVARSTVEMAERLLEVFNEAAGAGLGARTGDGRASQALKQIVGALIERPDEPADVWELGVRSMLADPPDWIEGRVMVGHLFGQRAASLAGVAA